jgi:hypothetical protein
VLTEFARMQPVGRNNANSVHGRGEGFVRRYRGSTPGTNGSSGRSQGGQSLSPENGDNAIPGKAPRQKARP